MNSRYQEVLDLHAPHPSPSRPLKTKGRALRKGSFSDVLASLDVSFAIPAFCLLKHEIKLILPFMSVEGAAIFGTGALPFEVTMLASFRGSLVLIMLPAFVVVAPLQDLSPFLPLLSPMMLSHYLKIYPWEEDPGQFLLYSTKKRPRFSLDKRPSSP